MCVVVYIRVHLALSFPYYVIYHPINTIKISSRKLVPLSLVRATTPNGKGAANQGLDWADFSHVVAMIFGASTGPQLLMIGSSNS